MFPVFLMLLLILQAEVTQRLSNAKAAVRVAALPSHVDLAKRLQVNMYFKVLSLFIFAEKSVFLR